MQKTRGPLVIELTTSALCDLNCTYCFEGEKVNKQRLEDFDTLYAKIEELTNDPWFKENYNGFTFSFWGGEPTLNHGYIVKVMEHFKDHPAIGQFHIYTNGFNFKNMSKIIDNVDTSKLHIQVSYDGKITNDIFRLTNKGTSTAEQVLNTFDKLAKRGIDVAIKSTLPTTSIFSLYDTWLEFEELVNKYKEYPNVKINFAPTIEYAMGHTPFGGETDHAVAKFEKQMKKIAKKEIEFYKEHGRFLCSWFGSSDGKTNCTAGASMMAVDVDGGVYACHGALYSPQKEDMKSATIFDTDFTEKVKTFADAHVPARHRINDICKGCVATYCAVCPVAVYDASKKTDHLDRWTDRCVNGLCKFYKAFGRLDRAVQHHINKLEK